MRGATEVRTLVVTLAAVVAAGCLSQSSLDGFRLPDEAWESGKTFTVRHQANDQRNLDRWIEASLRRHGLAFASNAAEADYVVSYIDRWSWDIDRRSWRSYLIDLRIDVREAETGELVATSRSYQTSVPAKALTHQNIVDRAVRILIEGAGADAPQPRSQRRPDVSAVASLSATRRMIIRWA